MRDKNQAVTPKLRFPKFRKEKTWKLVPLGGLLSAPPEYGINAPAVPYSEKLPTYLRITDIDDDGRFADEGKVSVAAKVDEQSYLNDGDVVVARTGASVGKSYRYREHDGRLVFAGFLIRLRPDPTKLVPAFLASYLTSRQYWDWVRVTSARSGQPGINGSEYAALPIPIPGSDTVAYGRSEQEKIADCVTSLDEVIAAQGRTVQALKTHKKGLMQHLFPREGETVPRLRFPEFRKAPAWEQRPAGRLFANRTEGGEEGHPIYSVTMANGLVKRSSLERRVDDIAEADANKKAVKNDIVYNMMRMWQGASGVAVEDCMVSPAYVVLVPQAGVHSHFFAFLLKLPQYLRLLTSHSQGLTKDRLRLYYRDFARIPLPIPDVREQEKIANLLSSIDSLIAVEMERLEALKTHKRGLLEQLFPSLEEVEP